MATIDFIDIGDVVKTRYLQGRIVTVDSTDDTCEVEVGGTTVTALIFYH